MIELRIQPGRPAVPLVDLSAAIGRTEAARTVGHSIEAMMAFLDELDGDPDLEDGNDMEPDADREVSYPEWHTRGRYKLTPRGGEMARTADVSDDDEDSDPAEMDDEPEDDDSDRCAAGDDMIRSGPTSHVIDWRALTSGSAGHEPGSEDDAEPEDRAAFREHIRLIRAVACTATVHHYYGGTRTTYRLTDPEKTVRLGVASDLLP